MNYWIFKVSMESTYADAPGSAYTYDNLHSITVAKYDEFLYLQKSAARYSLTGAGRVSKVTCRAARPNERRSQRVDRLFTAHLKDVVWFSMPFDITAQNKAGKRNRQMVGLPQDLNTIGWSSSMPRIDRELFLRLLDAALDAGPPVQTENDKTSWRVEDSWSLVKKRCRMQAFRAAVLARHNRTCTICGTRLLSVLDAAHITGYAVDPEQRANPANGICLCAFCHAAFDSGDVSILPDGVLQLSPEVSDYIALAHFSAISAERRHDWLRGVDETLLLRRATENRLTCRLRRP